MPRADLPVALVSIAALFVAGAGARGSLRSLVSGHTPRGWIALSTVSLLTAIAAIVTMIGHIVPYPREHALGATSAALLGYVALHAAIGLLFLLSNFLRINTGFVSQRRVTDLRLTRLWIDYTVVTGVIAGGLVLAAGNPKRARAVPTSQLWLVAGFCVWCSALVFSYALHSVGCAFAWPADKLRLIIGLTIIVHLAVIGWFWRIGTKVTSDPALGESGSFFHWVIVCTLIAAFVTIVFTLGPAMLLTICV